jgi:competence protein ComEA
MKFLLLLGIASAAFTQTLPDGPGKPVVERMCKGCHDLDGVVRQKKTKERWGEVVDDMVSRGAQGTDAEIDQVINYLAANFGVDAAPKVNVNKANASELTTTLGISAADADAIVHYRAEKGNFKTIQDVIKVPGIDAKKIESLQSRVEF